VPEVAVKRKWLILTLCAALAVAALLIWLAVEDARQAALLDASEREAELRAGRAFARVQVLTRDGAPAEEVRQAELEWHRAAGEFSMLHQEQARRSQPWHARLRDEVRRRTGW
jgi:hypothetical protein